MTARIKISQAGLAAGVAGKSRTDGLATGALVTLEDVSGTGSSTFHLLWGPVEDTTAEASLAVTGDPDIWTFSPTAAAYGSYEIELRDDGVPIERRIFGIRTPANQLLIPALNERASRHAGWHNDGADQIELCEQNASDFPIAALNNFRYAGWWRSLYELYRIVEFGIGSIANNAVALIKLVKIPAKSILANPTNALADVTTLAGSAALQHLRVNAANNALEFVTIDVGEFTAVGSRTVLMNAGAVSAVPAFVAPSAQFQYLRANVSNTGLEWSNLSGHASTSLVYDGATNTYQRAALTGAVTSAQNSNATAFGVLAAKSVLANATNGSAVPAALAGSAASQHLRVNSANNALEWATIDVAEFTAFAAKSVLANATNGSAVPAVLAGSAALQHLRVNSANNALEWATIDVAEFGSVAAKSVFVNAGPAPAAPAFLAPTVAFSYLRSNSSNNVLEWAQQGTIACRTTVTTATNSTAVVDCTGSFSIPANTLVAGSSFRVRFSFQFLRGATATALNLGAFLDVGGVLLSVVAAPASTVNGFVGYVEVEAVFTVLTTGAGGTAFAYLRASSNASAGAVFTWTAANTNPMAIDTTIANVIRGYGQMNAAVANCTINATGGDVQRVN
jgi:hypothetical protein